MRALLKDSEHAAKRKFFDPSTFAKPSRPWLDIEVGERFEVGFDEITESGLRKAAWMWTNRSGRRYAITRSEGSWIITRTE